MGDFAKHYPERGAIPHSQLKRVQGLPGRRSKCSITGKPSIFHEPSTTASGTMDCICNQRLQNEVSIIVPHMPVEEKTLNVRPPRAIFGLWLGILRKPIGQQSYY
jgi:hypothetical protein